VNGRRSCRAPEMRETAVDQFSRVKMGIEHRNSLLLRQLLSNMTDSVQLSANKRRTDEAETCVGKLCCWFSRSSAADALTELVLSGYAYKPSFGHPGSNFALTSD
jgi:hypothetical protein